MVKYGKGWFIIPGVQHGDRTFTDQAAGLEDAFASCKGKRVLDLGCAEGLLSHEFARRGAAYVKGIDVQESAIEMARSIGSGYPACEFEVGNINNIIRQEPVCEYDIVAALAIIHKSQMIEACLRWAARSCKDMLLLRTGSKYDGKIMRYKKNDGTASCDVPEVLASESFVFVQTSKGTNRWREDTQYWMRVT